jgi:hypothetical protein
MDISTNNPEYSNLETVIMHISSLNIQGLNQSLNDKYEYNDLPKKEYIRLLGGVFEKLKAAGTKNLVIRDSFCAGCQAGARVKIFISEETKRFFAFAIDTNDQKEVIDIFNCNKFTIKHFPTYHDYTIISFDTDENLYFEVKPFWDFPEGK